MRDFLGTGYIETRRGSPVDKEPSIDNSSDAVISRGSDFARMWVLYRNKNIGATIRIGREIQRLLYAGFLADPGEARGCSTNTSVIN